MKAMWRGKIIAQSNDTVVVEGNHYFPRDALQLEYITDSATQSNCPWKGMASYHCVVVDGETNPDAVWYYPEPKPAAKEITDRVAFARAVQVTE